MKGASEGGPVFVVGATGKTGAQIVQKLQARGVAVRALVRSAEKGKAIEGPNTHLIVGDINNEANLREGLGGSKAVVIASSATPIVEMVNGQRKVSYPAGGSPEVVDYQGQTRIVDAAKAAGVGHILIISSIGATQIGHFLNSMSNANILIWKYLAEHHARMSGIPYTVVRPGGLTDGEGGQQTIQVGQGDTINGRIHRADVAEVCVQALFLDSAKNRTFELIASDGPATTDFAALFDSLQPDGPKAPAAPGH